MLNSMRQLGAIAFTVLAVGSAQATETCLASTYSEGCCLASGGRFHPNMPLVAHRTLPFHSHVRIKVLATGKSIVVPVLDRGPFVRGRCVDLSAGAARLLGAGSLTRVSVEVVPNGTN